jgi:hypothetical protein
MPVADVDSVFIVNTPGTLESQGARQSQNWGQFLLFTLCALMQLTYSVAIPESYSLVGELGFSATASGW